MDAGSPSLFAMHPDGYPDIVVAGSTVSLRLFVVANEDQSIEPLHRHRVRVISSPGRKPFPHVYNDPRTDKWENYVAEATSAQVRETEVRGDGDDFLLPLRNCRVLLKLRFNLPKPKSYSPKIVHHTRAPDIDNYAKAILDALVKARIIQDDGLVTDLTIEKRYADLETHPLGVEIDLTAIPCEVP